jgi:SAM-dependent methyltransferase
VLESLYSNQYFTDYRKPRKPAESLLDRARVNLAWRLDRSAILGPQLFESITKSCQPKICDVGCGNGRLLRELRDHGFLVVGIEPSPFARETIESAGIKAYEGTAESLPASIPESPFDCVAMTHVLEHCMDPRLAVNNALTLVKTGGHVLIEVPNCGSFQFARRGPAWFHFDAGRHVNYFTPRGLNRLVEGCGAEFVKYYFRQYVDHFLPSRLDTEILLWDRSFEEQVSSNLAGLRKPSKLENWLSLLGSFAMRPERKYGCLGIVVRKAIPG